MAPVDIIIDILETAKNEALNERNEQLKAVCPDKGITYYDGKIDQCKELIEELEGFKKLFN